MELTFHIIYTPHSFTLFRWFLKGLLRWSDVRLRLVANGCSAEETAAIREFALARPRLDFLMLPGDGIMKHADALNFLQARERSEFFCFMDPDILVTAEFMPALTAALAEHAALFTGAPLWARDVDQVLPVAGRAMPGRYHRTRDGLCLGGTYFAVYRNEDLTAVRYRYGIGFERLRWSEIPFRWRWRIRRRGLKRRKYDTGKVLNLVLLSENKSLHWLELPGLYHVGGASVFNAQIGGLADIFRALDEERVQCRLPGEAGRRLWKKVQGLEDLDALYDRLTDEEVLALLPEPQSLRFVVSRLVSRAIAARIDGHPMPTRPELHDPVINGRLTALLAGIDDLFSDASSPF